jgi:hypothetical protein
MLSHGLECLFHLVTHSDSSEAVWKMRKTENKDKMPPLFNLNTPQTVTKTPTYSTYSLYPTTRQFGKFGAGLSTVNKYHATKVGKSSQGNLTPSTSHISVESVLSTPLSKDASKNDKKNVFSSNEGYDFCHFLVELMMRIYYDNELLQQLLSVCIATFNHHPARIEFISGQSLLIRRIKKSFDELAKRVKAKKEEGESMAKSSHDLNDLLDDEMTLTLFTRFLNIINLK